MELTKEITANYRKQIKEEKEKIFKNKTDKTEPKSHIVADKLVMSSETLYLMRLSENPRWMREV